MSYYMLCVLWLGALSDPPTIRYAKGEALGLRIAAGLWINKANKGYCIVGDKLYEKLPTRIGPNDNTTLLQRDSKTTPDTGNE